MELDIKQYLPATFHSSSKVWIYQSSRLLLISEALQLEELLQQFVTNWKTHGNPVKGYANLFFGQFIVLMADESSNEVSGCSIDSSVALIKTIETKYGITLLNRQMLAFYRNDKIELIPLVQLEHAINHHLISPHTLYFNNTITTKAALEKNWIIPAGESWFAHYFEPNTPNNQSIL